MDALIGYAIRSHSRRRGAPSRTLSETPAWLDFVLVGGFLYFDRDGSLLQANALGAVANDAADASGGSSSSSSSNSSSRWLLDWRRRGGGGGQIRLEGPFVAVTAVGGAMSAAGRMEPVTLPDLKAVGFLTFG